MSAIILGTVVVTSIVAAVYVSWPLLVGTRNPEAGGDKSESGLVLDELHVQKEATYSALKELEFDHSMGNLSGEDYGELVSRYEDRAVALLKSIDEVSQDEEKPEDVLEREIAALRGAGVRRGGLTGGRRGGNEIEGAVAALRAGRERNGVSRRAADDVEEEIAALRAARRKTGSGSAEAPAGEAALCPACRAPITRETAVFCSCCGASLRAACPSCRGQVGTKDFFCSECGAGLRGKNDEPLAQTVIGGVDA